MKRRDSTLRIDVVNFLITSDGSREAVWTEFQGAMKFGFEAKEAKV